MSEQQETVHVVMQGRVNQVKERRVKMPATRAVKVFDDRKDARDYRNRMNKQAVKFHYTVQSCLKG